MSSKQKRLIQLLGTMGAVYLIFKYLLPLVIPFFIAIVLAKMIKPAVKWFSIQFRLKPTFAATLILLVGGGILGWLVYWIGGQLLHQIQNFMQMWPTYEAQICDWTDCACEKIEHLLHLQQGSVTRMANDVGNRMNEELPQITVPYVAEYSAGLIGKMGRVAAVLTIIAFSVIFYIHDEEVYKKWIEQSIFGEEIHYFAGHLGQVGRAYLKTQGILMLITATVCCVGLYLIGNDYSILLGILIGIVDALPLFGTGTIFIPWVVADILLGRWKTAVKLLILYVICYILRQVLEPRMLGEKLGVTPLEIVGSVYVGLKLFGFRGLFLGPIAWIFWKEIDKKYFLA